LQHPGIPAVHQAGALADGRSFLAMKLIKGSTLENILKQSPSPQPLSPEYRGEGKPGSPRSSEYRGEGKPDFPLAPGTPGRGVGMRGPSAAGCWRCSRRSARRWGMRTRTGSFTATSSRPP
jgi:hypothetical protein